MVSKLQSDFVINFAQLLSDDGEMFFSCGDVAEDYKIITQTIDAQGYWAGSRYRYFFDEDLKVVKKEERRFGA